MPKIFNAINRPMSRRNYDINKHLCNEGEKYIKGLNVVASQYGKWQPPCSILMTEWKTGFLGFLCMTSVLGQTW